MSSSREPRALALQEVGPDLQVAQAQHHAEGRRQVQEIPEGNRRGDGQRKENNDAIGARLGAHVLGGGLRALSVGMPNCMMSGRHQPVDQRGHEQDEEFKERQLVLLPDHQGGDVAEGREGAAGIGRHDDADAGQRRRSAANCVPIASTTAPMIKRRRQVVEHAERKKASDAGEPEQAAVGQVASR